MGINNTVITGTGCYIPKRVVKNIDFVKQIFFEKDSSVVDSEGDTVVSKFKDITGISERRWAEKNQKASDIAAIAAEKAIKDAGIDPETIDQIIVANDFGDIIPDTIQTDLLPSLASRVKHLLKFKTPIVFHTILFLAVLVGYRE